MQQSEPKGTTSSGLSEVPSLIAYPRVLELKQIPEIKDQFVYVIKGYVEQGIAVMIYRNLDSGEVFLSIGDFDANPIDLTNETNPLQKFALEFAHNDSPRVIGLMKVARISKLIMYIAVYEEKPILVDLRTSQNKFYGPGMIRDLFSKVYPTQEVIKTVALSQDTIQAINRGEGSYKGDLILKTSAFKTVTRGNELLPMYAKVIRG
jgi:hypothetical protein